MRFKAEILCNVYALRADVVAQVELHLDLCSVAKPKDINYKYTNKIGTIEQNLPQPLLMVLFSLRQEQGFKGNRHNMKQDFSRVIHI